MTYALERRDLIPKMLVKWFWDLYDGVLYWLIMNLAVFFLGSIWTMCTYVLTAPFHPSQDAPLLAKFFHAGIQLALIVIPIKNWDPAGESNGFPPTRE